jgi:hypothetical protein
MDEINDRDAKYGEKTRRQKKSRQNAEESRY